MPIYHHCRELEHVYYDVVLPWRLTHNHPEPPCSHEGGCDRYEDWHWAGHMEASYRWLAERVGYWPLWLAVGETDDDRRMTGYQNQWSRATPASDASNSVLFSWSEEPCASLRYLCYDHWHIILNSVWTEEFGWVQRDGEHRRAYVAGVSPRSESWVFHASWKRGDWLRQARREPHTVQAVVPMLDLRSAEEIWCRNQAARRQLLSLGFDQNRVQVRRLAVSYSWNR